MHGHNRNTESTVNMRFDLGKSALIAEIIGGVAIVVTLIFLVLEIRSNTKSTQSQAYQDLIFELNDTRRDFFLEKISTILDKNRSGAELTDSDLFNLAQSLQIKWAVYETAYFAYSFGTLNQSGWSRFQEAICRNINYEMDKLLWDIDRLFAIKNSLNSEFAAYAEESCK